MALLGLLSLIGYTTTALLGLFTFLITLYIYRFKYNNYWKRIGIEYEEPIPLLGILFPQLTGKRLHEIDEEIYKRHGRVCGAYEVHRPILYISEPEHIKNILVKDFHIFNNRRDFTSGDPVADRFVSALKDDEWKRVRSIMSPTFTTGKIKAMIPNIGDCAIQSTKNFMKCAEEGKSGDCKKLFGNFTLDVIANTAFGTQLDSYNDPDNVFITHARKVFSVDISWKLVMTLISPSFSRKIGLNVFQSPFFRELTTTIIENRRKTKEVRNDFLQLMMESLESNNSENTSEIGGNTTTTANMNGKYHPGENGIHNGTITEEGEEEDNHRHTKSSLSTNELIAQCVLFFLAGYDTTATTLSMVCYNLALNQEVQKRVLKEVDDLWKKSPVLNAESLHDAKYLEATINETLRIFPPAVRLERKTGEDYLLGTTGIVIPKDTILAFPTYAMHRDPEFFPEPLQFRPERFLAENKDLIKPFTYMPFGSGPRNCIAMRFALMEIKINLMYLLREIEFDVCSDTKIPPNTYGGFGLFQPKDVFLKFIKRVNKQ